MNESTGHFEVSVTRVNTATNAFSVGYFFDGGEGESISTGTLQFADGEKAKTVGFDLPDNGTPGGDRSLQLVLRNPSANAVLGDPAAATIHVLENDLAGGVDASFSPSFARLPVVVVKQSDGATIVAPDNSVTVNRTRLTQLTRFTAAGRLDSTFNTPQFFYTEQMRVDSLDRIVFTSQVELLVPSQPVTLGRLRADGTLDVDFQTNVLSGRNVLSMALLQDGSVLLGRRADDASTPPASLIIQHFSSTGEPVPLAIGAARVGFDNADPFLGAGGITAIAPNRDGTVLIGGTFRTIDGVKYPGLVRLDKEGNLDQTFMPGIGMRPNSDVRAILRQEDSSTILGGSFLLPGSKTVCQVVRLTFSGAIDTNFTPVVVRQTASIPLVDPSVWQIVSESSGNLFIRGPFNTVQGESHLGVARLTSTGAVDSSFNCARYLSGGTISTQISSIFLDEPRGLVMAGKFSTVDFAPRTNLVRVLTVGRSDAAGVPSLKVEVSSTAFLIKWPAGYDGFILEESSSPGTGWVKSTLHVESSGGSFSVAPQPSESRRFFRLVFGN